MERKQLEHLIRAASAITNQYELVVIGSQSILGAYPDAPAELLASMEADIYPPNAPELSDLIDGSVGEYSAFHNTFGFYAQGVGPETAILPEGWKDRLVKIRNAHTDMKIGYCLDPHDLAASKLAAGREKDWAFVAAMLQHDLADFSTLRDRLNKLPVPEAQREQLNLWLARQAKPQVKPGL